MDDPRDLDSLIKSAEQAAETGDHAGALKRLERVAALQEKAFGPLSPKLANTLNNLGVLYELNERPAEAEASYRRAFRIARSVLQPDHPFVATSERNLRDFCHVRGLPVQTPVADEAPALQIDDSHWDEGAFDAFADSPQKASAPLADPVPITADSLDGAPAPGRSRALTLGLAIVLLLLAGLWAGSRLWFSENAGAAYTPSPAPAAEVPSPPVVSPGTPPPASSPAPAAPVPEAPASPAASVVDARICRPLVPRGAGAWQCDAPASPAGAGPFFFYTRVKSPTGLDLEHRWYRDDELQRTVDLRIQANPSEGYRTYSRNTVTQPGEWRVELRTKDGAVLDVKRFTVR